MTWIRGGLPQIVHRPLWKAHLCVNSLLWQEGTSPAEHVQRELCLHAGGRVLVTGWNLCVFLFVHVFLCVHAFVCACICNMYTCVFVSVHTCVCMRIRLCVLV